MQENHRQEDSAKLGFASVPDRIRCFVPTLEHNQNDPFDIRYRCRDTKSFLGPRRSVAGEINRAVDSVDIAARAVC